MGSKRSSRAGLAACRLRAALEISLANDELYAVAAYILQLNRIIGDSEVMRAQPLPWGCRTKTAPYDPPVEIIASSGAPLVRNAG